MLDKLSHIPYKIWVPGAALVGSIGIGCLFIFLIPLYLVKYTLVIALALLDCLGGGILAKLENSFNQIDFGKGVFFNIALAVILTYSGELAKADLYLVAIFIFGMRLFRHTYKLLAFKRESW